MNITKVKCDFCGSEHPGPASMHLSNKLFHMSSPIGNLCRQTYDFCNLDCVRGWIESQQLSVMCCMCKQRKSEIHITQIKGDKLERLEFCKECAKAKGIDGTTGFSLSDLLLGLGEPKPTP